MNPFIITTDDNMGIIAVKFAIQLQICRWEYNSKTDMWERENGNHQMDNQAIWDSFVKNNPMYNS